MVEFEVEGGPKGPKAVNVQRVTTNSVASTISREDALSSIRKLASVFNEASKREFTFLMLGRTGVGKSSTVNTLIGQQIAEVGDFRPTTFTVRFYQSQIQGVKIFCC